MGNFDKNVKVLSYLKKKNRSFLSAFDKYVKSMCYFRELFQCFGSIRKLFGMYVTNFENSKEILCFFLKTPEFGRSPEIREPAKPL